MIKLIDVTKTYETAGSNVLALDRINITFERGSFSAIIGPSGCGKTTLLNILAGYDKPSEGEYWFNRQLVSSFEGKELDEFFRHEAGTVFQEFHLLPYLNVYENIALPSYYSHTQISKDELDYILDRVGLVGLGKRFPEQLSGGQKQRVAIARILVQKCRLLLADEPTGALDRDNSIMVMNLFKQLQKEGMTVIMVTHDREMAQYADAMYRLEQGHVVV